MTGLDANVLVRYLAQDDPAQCAIVDDLFHRQLSSAKPGYVSLVALTETMWVLLNRYKADKVKVAEGLLVLFLSRKLVFQEEQCVFAALLTLKNTTTDFADAMIAYLGSKRGCHTTLTFDKRASRHSGFTLL